MENIVEKVIDRSIFKTPVKFIIHEYKDCFACLGTGVTKITNGLEIVCPICFGSKKSPYYDKKEVEGKVQYVPMAFEENKIRILQISVTYYESERPINLSIPEEDLLDFVEVNTTLENPKGKEMKQKVPKTVGEM